VTRTVIFLTPIEGPELARARRAFGDGARVEIVRSASELEAVAATGMRLVCMGSGVIVAPSVLERLGCAAYNIHAASPDFPGRDPHHHAVYRGASSYGATLHVMTARVDDGPIVAVSTFPVPAGASPAVLLAGANAQAMALLEEFGPRLAGLTDLPTRPDLSWGPVKTRRSDLARLARISPLMPAEEVGRRIRAFETEGHRNVRLHLDGRRFALEPGDQSGGPATDVGWSALRRLLGDLRAAGLAPAQDTRLRWTHPVRLCLASAGAIAKVLAAEGIAATFLLDPASGIYNLNSAASQAIVHEIAACGHEVGVLVTPGTDIRRGASLMAVVAPRTVRRGMAIDAQGLPCPSPALAQGGLDDLGSWHGIPIAMATQGDTAAGLADRLRAATAGPEVLHVLTEPISWREPGLPWPDLADIAVLDSARRSRAAVFGTR
jgi:DNA-binding transcriptional ArsR family regulator